MRHTPFVLACGIALGGTLLQPVVASRPDKPPRGARIAVVAFHDSRLLTVCPVFGKDVIESNIWTTGMAAKATVSYPPDGLQSIGLFFDDKTRGRVYLPMPAAGTHGGSSPRRPSSGPGELDRLARDVGVEKRLAEQFRARTTYTVADSPDDADFVFVAESSYVPLLAGVGDQPPARSERDSAVRIFRDVDEEWRQRTDWSAFPREAYATQRPFPVIPTLLGIRGGDRHLNWRQAIVAIVVPASIYRQHAGDGDVLAAASVWNGITAEGWKPRTNKGRRPDATDESRTRTAASPEALVDRFHARGGGLPAYLPVCAATAGRIRSIEDPAVEVRTRPAENPVLPRAAGEREPAGLRLRLDATLVAVPVTVTDRTGQPVLDLPMSAIRVFEDGVEQKIERLEPGTARADTALLIDTSGSMRAVREEVRASAPAVAGALRSADRAMVVSFNSRIRVLSEFTGDRPALRRALAEVAPGGGTRLYDALALVTVDRLRRMEGRKAVVLLTDGVDTHSQLTDAAGALAAIESSDTPVYVIRYETGDAGTYLPPGAFGIRSWLVAPDSPEKLVEAHSAADRFLVRLSSGSGGRLYSARPGAAVAEMLAQVGDDLSNQLTVGYYPINDKQDGTYRRITVNVDCADCSVRARTGYRAGVRDDR